MYRMMILALRFWTSNQIQAKNKLDQSVIWLVNENSGSNKKRMCQKLKVQ